MEGDTSKLAGRVAVVTGATSGIGEAVVRRFAREGAAVVAHGRSRAAGEALARDVRATGADAEFVTGDVRAPADAQALADAARERHGHVDVLVLNAGTVAPAVGPFWEVPVEEFDAVWETNVRGAWLCARACAPLLRPGGAIVVTASTLSFVAEAGYTAYAASKGAVLQLARGMAADLLPREIRVNAICPGTCDTPMTATAFADPSQAVTREAAIASVPMGRLGTPEEIAQAVLFLASPDSSFCTGASLLADGGATIF